MVRDSGWWSRASIQRDRERFERAHPEPFAGDPWPPGMTPEQIGGTPAPHDPDYEPNTYGGA